MAPIALESEDHLRDAAFNKVMHGKSVDSKGFRSMFNKDHTAHQAATEEYFKHWDNKSAGAETVEIREVNAERSAKYSKPQLTAQLGAEGRICFSYQALLQSRHRSLRIWLGGLIPFLSFCLR